MNLKSTVKTLSLPIFLLIALGTLFILWKVLDLPSQEELIKISETYFEKYGLITVFVSAIIEAFLVAGMYYPGSIVIFLGVIFAGDNIPAVALVVLVTTLGMLISLSINFLLGKYGWHKLFLVFGLEKSLEIIKLKLGKYGMTGMFWSYFHPNITAFISTAAGILHVPFKKFFLYSALVVSCWNIFWGTLAYIIGEKALTLIGFRFVLIVVVLWIMFKLLFGKSDTENTSGASTTESMPALTESGPGGSDIID